MSVTLPELVLLLNQLPEGMWWALSALLVLVLVRQGVLDYKTAKLDNDTLDYSSKELTRLRAEVDKLTAQKALLISFSSRVLQHFGGCRQGCGNDHSRELLQGEFDQLMSDLT